MTLTRPSLLPLALVVAAAFAGCGGGGEGGSGKALRVVATTTQVGDLVRNVGGDRVQVRTLLRPNVDPHGYEPRPSDARALQGAEVVFRSGGELDGWLQQLLDSAGGDARRVTLIDSVKRRGNDPHWWQDPRNARLAVRAIRTALVAADPDGRNVYDRHAAAYTARLSRLDRGIARCMAEVPSGERKLVTTHDALGYFAARYDVQIIGALIPSLSTQAQPSAKDTDRLVRQIRAEKVHAIFPETALNPKLEQAVSREAGAEVGKALWADSLGPRGSDGATYLQAMAANTQAMVDGMTGGAVSCRPSS